MTRGTRGRGRRTQADRRAHTYAALLDATADCLVERGYAHTSTNDIIRMAGVSRGALLHHFASKADLLGAAAEHVVTRCEREFREAFAAMPVEERTLERAIDQLWEIHRGPSFDAVLELLVAARTDSELRAVLQQVLERFERNVSADFGVLFPATASAPESRAIQRFAFATLSGAAIAGDLGLDDQADDILGMLRGLARGVGAMPPPAMPTASAPPAAHTPSGPSTRPTPSTPSMSSTPSPDHPPATEEALT